MKDVSGVIRVLIIEDDKDDYYITNKLLSNISTIEYKVDWVDNYNTALDRIAQQEHDVYLVDYNLKDHNGIELVETAINSGIYAPFIFLTGQDDFRTDSMALEIGASDYLIKNTLSEEILERSIRYSIKQKKIEKDLIEANATKIKLFTIIGHDLRGPLGNILSMLHLIVQKGNLLDPDKQKAILEGLVENSKSTFDLLENLLNWARSQLNAVQFRPDDIKLSQHVNKSLEILKAKADSKKIKFKNLIDNDIIVFADIAMLQVILRNLLTNAIKFTNENGEIVLAASEKNSSIIIEVNDNGVGMDENTADLIFSTDKFYSSYGTNNEKGTGLGLKLCKEFATKNGGDLWVESLKNKGSSFFFSLPKNR